MRIVPLITKNKLATHKEILADGGEGLMLKDIDAPYTGRGRPKSMYKLKRYDEVDAFVTGFSPGKKGKGWELLVGDLEFSCYTETGKRHMVAKCSNFPLEDRIDMSHCATCGSPLNVNHDNVKGKRVILGTTCTGCHLVDGGAVLNASWLNRVACVQGQEWTARVYRLKHATIERWRTHGEDAKSQSECTVNLKDIQHRFQAATRSVDL